jgi:hypothetical protein
MGPGVRREARLVCVCTNEFAQTFAVCIAVVCCPNAGAPYRTARGVKLLTKDEARRIAANIAKVAGAANKPGGMYNKVGDL